MSYQSHYFKEVRERHKNAYAPYSNFKVGAYLKTKDGRCFMEQMLRTLHIRWEYAERSSLVSAISEGYQPGDFESITVTVDADKPSSPCGACRQVMMELVIKICLYI